MVSLKEAILNRLVDFENLLNSFIDDNSILKSLDLVIFNDDLVVYCCVYVLAAIFIFIICIILTNFYRVKSPEIVYGKMDSQEKKKINKAKAAKFYFYFYP